MLIKKHLEEAIDLLLKLNTLQKRGLWTCGGFSYWDICWLYSTHENWALLSGWKLVVCVTAKQIMHLGFSRATWHEICPNNRKLYLLINSFYWANMVEKTGKPSSFVPALYFLPMLPTMCPTMEIFFIHQKGKQGRWWCSPGQGSAQQQVKVKLL